MLLCPTLLDHKKAFLPQKPALLPAEKPWINLPHCVTSSHHLELLCPTNFYPSQLMDNFLRTDSLHHVLYF